MKKILGLDLGSASVGWAMIAESECDGNHETKILGLGSRIIPYNGTEGNDFSKGAGESRNSVRTKMRTARKGYDRYQLRRKNLVDLLVKNNMMPDYEAKSLSKIELWKLRSDAVNTEISNAQLGRIMLWLNQKRGYKSGRSDANLDKKDTEYVAMVKSRHEQIKEKSQTIGQYFYSELQENEFFRIKDNVFPREAYIEEFDAICDIQRQYNSALTDVLINRIRNEIIYYQRPLKSCKGLVSICEFEGFWTKKGDKEYFVGPKVAPKSSPLFQLSKIWENINNIKLGSDIDLTPEQKHALFEYLDNNEKLTSAKFIEIIGLKKGFVLSKQLDKGLSGNITKSAIKKCFGDNKEYEKFLKLELKISEGNGEGFLYNKTTGEVLNSKPVKFIDPSVEKEPLYQLWHTIYSISDMEECSNALQAKFSIDKATADRLAAIDFTKHAFGNKSAKAIRKILPYLIEGDGYSAAMSYGGYDHSNSLTKDQNTKRELLDRLKPIPKNSLRQPIVEKILNQMANTVNAVIERYGKPDEIRIELARELKQSKDERGETERYMNKRQRENEDITKRLAEYGLRATRNNILKWRLYEEIDNKDKKLNAMCIYCGQHISLTEAIKGSDVDIEHIIPKSKLFDDSQSNKTLAHRHCNRNKNDMTAYDFMCTKSEQELNEYVDRVEKLYSSHIIGKAKRDKLLMTEDKIPDNFIDRQLRESQYIAKKSREILQSICHNVWATSGAVTAELRHLWGWDEVTMNLQFAKYKKLDLTEIKEWESDHGRNKHSKEVIKDWSKRNDHRHHGVDALTIACTKQGFIQRFNTLNTIKTKDELRKVVENYSDTFKERLSLLGKYIVSQQPLPVSEVEQAVDNMLISFKSGKKVAVTGKRKIGKKGDKRVVQQGIVIPRGALHQEFVYGKIKSLEIAKPIKYLFENPSLIVKSYIREHIEQRIAESGDCKKALASLKKQPIYLDKDGKVELKYGSCYTDEYVLRYPVKELKYGDLKYIVDKRAKEAITERLELFGNDHKMAFKDLDKNPIYLDPQMTIPVKRVRLYTKLSALEPVKFNESGEPISFVKPANNHHIAIYRDREGALHEHVTTFWHAVERKKYSKLNGIHIPTVITNPETVWDTITQLPEEKQLSETFLEKLPDPSWTLELSMQQNEMFVLGMEDETFANAVADKSYSVLSKNLYRVQKLSSAKYVFRHHLETTVDDKYGGDKNELLSQKIGKLVSVRSLGALQSQNPHKVRINILGEIVP